MNRHEGQRGEGRRGEGEPRREAGAVQRAVEAEDRRRAERPAGEAGQVPGAVRLAPPRPRGRTIPGRQGPLPHGVPGPARLAGGGRVPRRPPWGGTPPRRRGGGARPAVRAGLDAEHRQRAERADGRPPGPHLSEGSMAKRGEKAVLFLCTGNYYRSRFAEALFNSVAV